MSCFCAALRFLGLIVAGEDHDLRPDGQGDERLEAAQPDGPFRRVAGASDVADAQAGDVVAGDRQLDLFQAMGAYEGGDPNHEDSLPDQARPNLPKASWAARRVSSAFSVRPAFV